MGATLTKLGDYPAAEETLSSALSICEELHNLAVKAEVYLRLAELQIKLGNVHAALTRCEEALELSTALGISLLNDCQQLKESLVQEVYE